MIVIVTLAKLMNPAVTVCVNRDENNGNEMKMDTKRNFTARKGWLLYVLSSPSSKFTEILSD